MLIDKEKVAEAKEKLGDRNAEIMADELGLENYDAKNKKACCPYHSEDTPSFIYNNKNHTFHCFAGETTVITKDGVKTMADIVDKPCEVINGNGEWEKVIFRCCGKQKLMKLYLTKNCKKKVIYATPEHEWIVREKRDKVQTQHLKVGYRLDQMWLKGRGEIIPSIDGMRHGFIYGDGHITNSNTKNGTAYTAAIHTDDKLNFCKKIFKGLSYPKSNNYCMAYASITTPKSLKQVPDYNEPYEYLLGFLIGYFVADGNCSDESVQIASAKFEDLIKVKHICTLLGIATYPIGSYTRTPKSNMGILKLTHNQTMYNLRLAKSTLPTNFFQSEKKLKSEIVYNTYLGYKVEKVEMTDRFEDVYCCETSTHSFVLEDFILTGNCFGCQKNVDIIDVFMSKGMTYIDAAEKLFELAEMPHSFGEKHVKTKISYHYPKPVECTDKSKVYDYFQTRGISKETLDYCDVSQDEHGNAVFNYYDTNDVLTMVKYRPSRKINRGENKTWCQKGADTSPILFNMNRTNTAKPLLITEGEPDCMAAIESGYSNTVSVPLGAGNFHWIEECWEWLEQFDSIIICSDNDEAGLKMQKEVVYRLGSWRCKTVNIPHSYKKDDGTQVKVKDLNEVLYYWGKSKVIELITNATDTPVDSVLDYSDIKNIDLDNIDGIYTGFKDIDRKLMKLFYGSFNIVTGVNGSGKSSFLSQLVCQSLEQGKNVWMYSGELPNFQSKNWINYILAGQRNVVERQINGTQFWKVTAQAQNQMDKFYKNRLFIYKDGYSHKVSDLIQSMIDSIRKYGAKLIIIDNLTCVNLECNENNKYSKQEEFITQCIDVAKKFNVTVVLVCHPHKIETMRRLTKMDVQGISAIIDLAHRIISLYRVTPDDKKGKPKQDGKGWYKEPIKYDVLADILKDRMLGFEGSTVGLYYDRPSRRFFTNESDLDYRYSWDKTEYSAPLPFPPPQLTENNTESEVFGAIQPQ